VNVLMDVLAEIGLADVGGPQLVGDPDPAALASPLAVGECAVASVFACLAAAAELSHARSGRRPEVVLDTAHVAAAVRSEVLLRNPAGQGLEGFAPLSRLWQTTDGWVRTHANYPWHRTALLAALGADDGPDSQVERRLAEAVAARTAVEVERLAYGAGGLAVAARTQAQWQTEGPATDASAGLVSIVPAGAGGPLPRPGPLPASNLRVLDLTRVIAGPVGTRMLGALGADVLRVDQPKRPELPSLTVEGVIGKASTLLDAGTQQGRKVLHQLAAEADVVVTGYRPGALRHLGLDPDQITEQYPGAVVATLSAWGTDGEWGRRRGFDSLVQIATGIGWAASTDGTRPGTLPCQLLDHATGYLLAAGVLTALARRARTGKVAHVSVSLARTAQWLLHQDMRAPRRDTSAEPQPHTDAYRVALGDGWTGVSPPGRLDGRPLSWPCLPPAYGRSPAAWRDRP
jgi:crotonobetainyl-CoA:carnitine CoA-transferase CaiB-like acyl-CoA transferase